MRNADLVERLSQMVVKADDDAALRVQGIARQCAAAGRLQSGNFFIEVKNALGSEYDETLKAMEVYALSVAAPKAGSAAIKSTGQDLETKFLSRLESVLSGGASGNPCPDSAAEQLRKAFQSYVRERLNQTVSDVAKNALGKPVRGWQGWIIRYGWNLLNTAIALAALYISWIKK